MKVVLLRSPGGPEALEVMDRPAPEPGPGTVRVRAKAIGVGRPDVMMRTGRYKWMPPLPGVIGNELAGIVDAVGAGADAAWLGRSVLVSARELETRGGCYAEQVIVPAQALIALPDEVDAAAAVALPNFQLAWALLHEATRGRIPRSVYLNGAAGGVGTAVIQTCTFLGIDVIAGASTLAKRELATLLGARAVVDTALPASAVIEAVRAATDSRGVDMVLDHVCGPRLIGHLQMLAPFGLLVSYNALGGPAEDDVFAALRNLANKAIGLVAFNMHVFNGPAMRDVRQRLLAAPLQWMAEGRLRPSVDTRFSLDDIRHVHGLLDAGDTLGKVVVTT